MTSHRPHAAPFSFPRFGGVDEGPAHGAHRQAVAATLPSSKVLKYSQIPV